MKTYIDAELQIVRLNNRDIVTESLAVSSSSYDGPVYGSDRFRDEE